MARPKKKTVDYFPHQCQHKKTLSILESKYGNDGYAFWFKLLESLGSTENHYLDCNDFGTWEFLQAETHLSEGFCTELLDLLSRLGAIDQELWENRVIWCQNFVDGIADVYVNRKVDIPEKPSFYKQKPFTAEVSTDRNSGKQEFSAQPTVENRQSKVKESKVNKTTTTKTKSERVNDAGNPTKTQSSKVNVAGNATKQKKTEKDVVVVSEKNLESKKLIEMLPPPLQADSAIVAAVDEALDQNGFEYVESNIRYSDHKARDNPIKHLLDSLRGDYGRGYRVKFEIDAATKLSNQQSIRDAEARLEQSVCEKDSEVEQNTQAAITYLNDHYSEAERQQIESEISNSGHIAFRFSKSFKHKVAAYFDMKKVDYMGVAVNG